MRAFIARQPVFDRERRVCAYELLFRNGIVNAVDEVDGTGATTHVMTASALLFGVETLVGDKKAHVKLTREALVRDYGQLLPPDRVIPEILEDVPEDEPVLSACGRLKQAGYDLALGGIRADRVASPLLDLVDIVKVDFLSTDERERRILAERFSGGSRQLVAKRVETYEDFARAMDQGFGRFQGFFFAKPEVLSKQAIQAPNRVQYLTLLQRIHDPVLSFDGLHDVISKDATLSYRLLKYLNSACFGFRADVKSIRHALILLGENGIRKWATLLSMVLLGDQKPPELLATALARANFCEGLASLVHLRDRSQELFLLGLLSTLDALMDQPLAECLSDVPIATEIKDALLGTGGRYRDILDLAVYYEKSDWASLSRLVASMDVSPAGIPDVYLDSIQRSREVFGAQAA